MVLWGGRRGGGACSGGGAMMGQVGYGGGGGGGGAPVDPLGPRLERQLGERDGRGVGGIALAVEHDEGAQLQTMMSWGGFGGHTSPGLETATSGGSNHSTSIPV